MTDRYTDPFLNALMYSHQITIRAELWRYDPAEPNVNLRWKIVGPLNIVSGSISADRSGSVRRTAQIVLNPEDEKSTLLGPYLNPYGPRVKIWRGIRYAGGGAEEIQCFYGRIDVVESSLAGLTLRCSDLAADVVDGRFLDIMTPQRLAGAPTTLLGCIKALITDIHPTMTFDTALITDTTAAVRSGTQWIQERGDALDSLCTQLQGGCEWFISMTGVATVRPLPAVLTSGTPPAWIIDSGDVGVLVDRVGTLDRQGVYNGVRVESEPVNGDRPAIGTWKDDPAYGGSATSATRWGYAFGKVVSYYTGQQVDTTIKADALAKTLGVNSIASVRSVSVTCIPNSKLQLGDPVRVYTGSVAIDGMYFVQNFNLPLDPETAMTMTLYTAYQTTPTGGYEYAEPLIPEGATWQPTR